MQGLPLILNILYYYMKAGLTGLLSFLLYVFLILFYKSVYDYKCESFYRLDQD